MGRKRNRSQVDETLKELSVHGSFGLPVETYTDNCVIFHSLYHHWHEEMELICVEKGSGFGRLNTESLRLKQGDILVINRGVLHSMKTDLKNPLYYKSVLFHLDFLRGMAGDICQEQVVAPLLENRAEVTHLLTPESAGYEQIHRLFYAIHDCHNRKEPYYFVKLKALLFDLFYEMLANDYIIPSGGGNRENLAGIKTVLDYIHQNYREKMTVEGLTALTDYSESHFARIFREYTGKAPIEYCNGYRLEQAVSFLLNSDMPVTELGMNLGFNNTSYFFKLFQAAYGMSPGKYRRIMAKKS